MAGYVYLGNKLIGYSEPEVPKNTFEFEGYNYMISPGNLYYTIASGYQISDNWYDHCSYRSASGETNNSSYFMIENIYNQFDSHGDFAAQYAGTLTNIDNAGTLISYGDYNDWSIPEPMVLQYISQGVSEPIQGRMRVGSTVNGSSNQYSASVYVTGATLNGYTATLGGYGPYSGSGILGVLIFPDGKVYSGASIVEAGGPGSFTAVMGKTDLDYYTDNGCAFIPVGGGVVVESSLYWSSLYRPSSSYSSVCNTMMSRSTNIFKMGTGDYYYGGDTAGVSVNIEHQTNNNMLESLGSQPRIIASQQWLVRKDAV